MLTVPLRQGEPALTAEVETIYRVAYRLTGNRHDAEDLVQDVCERALSKAPEFASADDCRRWLLRVLYNRFVDGTRARRRRRFFLSAADSREADSARHWQDPAEQTDDEAALGRAWSRLEPAQQALLSLSAEGHDLAEISRITGIDRHSLSSRLYRARTSLARYLQDEPTAQRACAHPEKVR